VHTKETIQTQLDALKRQYGEWTYDIPLPYGIWTRGNLQIPHTRLKRIVQVVSDLSQKHLSESRVLDLGCLDGLFSIEFAKHGASTVGVEIREANVKKAAFCQDALGLTNLEFRQDDVRNLSLESYGRFDAIVCSGILYHLPAVDAIKLIHTMFEMVDRVVVIDTHVALKPVERFVFGEHHYWGSVFREHADGATAEEKEKRLWASADNPTSFWFTRPSLVNILTRAGFSSAYECFVPAHLNFGKPGLEHRNRCTFVAIKDEICDLVTSPSANKLQEEWPEDSLAYVAKMTDQVALKPLYRKLTSRLKRTLA
jgi:2-polyprenyl-3-methyl-5-hydroxy-6-metoxy-1,4-benzoquinol methylase